MAGENIFNCRQISPWVQVYFLMQKYIKSSVQDWLVSVAGQAGLYLTWSQNPEGTFSRDVAQYIGVQLSIHLFMPLSASPRLSSQLTNFMSYDFICNMVDTLLYFNQSVNVFIWAHSSDNLQISMIWLYILAVMAPSSPEIFLEIFFEKKNEMMSVQLRQHAPVFA